MDQKRCSSCCRLKSHIHFKYLKTKDEYTKTCDYCREKSRKCVIRQKEAGTWVQPNKYIPKKQQNAANGICDYSGGFTKIPTKEEAFEIRKTIEENNYKE